MRRRLREYRALFRKIERQPWVKWALGASTLLSTYDLWLSQLVPEKWAKNFPKAWEVAVMTGGWIPWWGWLLILAAILVVSSFEYAIRSTRMHRRSRVRETRRHHLLNRSLDIVSFNRDDGAVLPNSTNATNVSKMAPNVFKETFVKPVDQSTICTAMSGTPSLFKYEIDPTGSTATYIWPANIELPEILSVGNYKPGKS